MIEIGLIGKKIGMTREFYKTGQSVPVTVIKFDKGRVIHLLSKEKNGYNAVQIGFGKIKNSKLSKQMKGYYAKKNTEPKKILKEFRVKSLENFKEGNEIGIEIFKDTKFVDIRSKTIGKGFAGAMKRHNFLVSEQLTEFQYHTDLMAQQVKDKTQEKYLKIKKWPVKWVIKKEQC